MSKRNKVVVGGALLGSALLATALTSPGTLATWSQNINLDNTTITSGNLEAAPLGSMQWQDVSGATPSNIDMNTYKIVPGDVILGSQNIDAAAEGDNILASMNINFALASSGDLLPALTVTYDVVDENGDVVVPETPYGTNSPEIVINESDVTPDLDSTKDYTFRVKAVFPDTIVNRDYTEMNAILNSAQVKVKQIRATAPINSGSGPISNPSTNIGTGQGGVPIAIGSGITLASMGYDITFDASTGFVVQADGTVKAWGNNAQGSLGMGDTVNRTTPTLIPGVNNVKSIALASGAVYALKHDGSVMTWGSNAFSKLGYSSATTNELSPSVSTVFTNVKDIKTSGHSVLVLMNDGTMKAAGMNWDGQLGQGDTNGYTSAVTVPLTGVEKIEGGASFHAILTNGHVYGWGDNSGNQIVGAHTNDVLSPTQIPINNVTSLSCFAHCFARDVNGDLWGWGGNTYGQLGINGTTNVLTPTQITQWSAGAEVVAVATNTIVNDPVTGTYFWGMGDYGQLGDGALTTQTTPTLTNVFQHGDTIYNNGLAFMVKRANGDFYAWGFVGADLGLTSVNPMGFEPAQVLLSVHPS